MMTIQKSGNLLQLQVEIEHPVYIERLTGLSLFFDCILDRALQRENGNYEHLENIGNSWKRDGISNAKYGERVNLLPFPPLN